jgi:DNA repair exonuclease SbcCD ATPase subunit
MPKGAPKPAVAIERLLEERQQIQRWLERLEMAGEAAPEHVKARVRADYEKRLSDVMAELRSHAQELAEALERQQTLRAGLARQEANAAERLAEAELRHAVGEYGEAQWREVHAQLLEALVRIREELKHADEEIAKLNEVVRMLGVSAPAVALSGAGASPGIDGKPQVEPAESKKEEGKKERGTRTKVRAEQTDALDELAFLKAVAGEGSEDLGRGKVSPEAPAGAGGPGVEEPVKVVPDATPQVSRASKAVKTLKCAECGTMNLPTEWYCERCGAELAAL